jgi:hypothetical protein
VSDRLTPPPDTTYIKTGTSPVELVAFVLGIALVVGLLAFACRDDGMAVCQRTHSFDVCHDALN